MKRRILALALVLITALSIVPAVSAEAEVEAAPAFTFTFLDVPTNHPHRRAIEFCARNDFVRGHTTTRFDPDGRLTREQFALIWARTLRARMHAFDDVQRINNEADNAILLMQALRHIEGVSHNHFSRRTHITREQALTVAYRAYIPGVNGQNAANAFPDFASISEWARGPISAIKHMGLLHGMFTGNELRPLQDITRGELCQLIYNIMREEYRVAIPTTFGGTVTANRTNARPGETITLTVSAISGMRLVPGSVRFNGEATTGTYPTFTFTMPGRDVTVTAEFEQINPLVSIAVTTPPTTATFTVGHSLNLAGMVVTATYADNTTQAVTAHITTTPAAGTVLNTVGTIPITISYTELGITRTTTQLVTVTPAAPPAP
ncbi:MAG: S-layer homology domain-containing protein [Oscillospiraceae bacterium]|nr:S-layer homology domain-containing protein [Oscillospiraceae bacterium]